MICLTSCTYSKHEKGIRNYFCDCHDHCDGNFSPDGRGGISKGENSQQYWSLNNQGKLPDPVRYRNTTQPHPVICPDCWRLKSDLKTKWYSCKGKTSLLQVSVWWFHYMCFFNDGDSNVLNKSSIILDGTLISHAGSHVKKKKVFFFS